MGEIYASIQKIYHLIMAPENRTKKYSSGSWGIHKKLRWIILTMKELTIVLKIIKCKFYKR